MPAGSIVRCPSCAPRKPCTDMASGQTLRVVATDAGSVRDFLAFAKQTGNELVEHGEQDSEFWFVLKRR